MAAPVARSNPPHETCPPHSLPGDGLAAAAEGLARPLGLDYLNADLLSQVTRHFTARQSRQLAVTYQAVFRRMTEEVGLPPPKPTELEVSVFNLGALDYFRGRRLELEQLAEHGPLHLRFCQQASFDQFKDVRTSRVQSLEMPVFDPSSVQSRVEGALAQLPSLSSLTLRLDAKDRAALDIRDMGFTILRQCEFRPNLSGRLRELDLTDFRLNKPAEFLQNVAKAFPNLHSLAISLRNPAARRSTYVPLGLADLRDFADRAPKLRQFELSVELHPKLTHLG